MMTNPNRQLLWIGLAATVGWCLMLVTGCGDKQSRRAEGRPVEESSSGIAEARSRAEPPLTPVNDLDVSLASDLFLSVWVVHPQQILTSELLSEVEFETALAQITNEIPFELATAERLTILVPAASSPDPAAIPVIRAEYAQPVVVEELVAALDTEAQQETIDETTVFRIDQPPMSIYQESSQVVVIGNSDLIPRLVGSNRPATGRLAELLSQTELDKHVVAVISGTTLQSMMGAMGAMNGILGGGDRRGPPSIEAVYLFIDLDDNYLARLRVTTGSVAQAEELVVTMRSALAAMRRLVIPAMMAQAREASSDRETMRITRFFQQLIEGIQVDAKDELVRVYFDRPDGLKEVLSAMAVLADRERQIVARHEHLQQTAMAIRQALDSDDGFYPRGIAAEHRDENGVPLLSWRVYLLPRLGHDDLFQRFHLDEPWDSDHNRPLLVEIPDIFRIDETSYDTAILAVHGTKTALAADRELDWDSITDPHADTMIVVEVNRENAVPWTKPVDLEISDGQGVPALGQDSEPLVLAGFLDGQAWRLPKSLNESQWRALMTSSGNERVRLQELIGQFGAMQIRPGR